MSDVIFAGSETRSPLKRCEVALTFDNTDHFLNTDLQDVEVKKSFIIQVKMNITL